MAKPAAGAEACAAPRLSAEPLSGGRIGLMVDSACRRGQAISVAYGEYTFTYTLDAAGKSNVVLDLFLGANEGFRVVTADGKEQPVTPVAGDVRGYSKVALIWQKPVDLDLHAIEGNAQIGSPGTVWARAARTGDEAKALVASTGRGAGFLSTSNDGKRDGTKVEVYTFLHSPDQAIGAVPFAIDYASRGAQPTGDACGQGALAEVAYEVVMVTRGGDPQRDNGIIPAVKCGEALDGKARYIRNAVPDLRFRR